MIGKMYRKCSPELRDLFSWFVMLDFFRLLGCLEKSDPSAKISLQEKRNVNQTPHDATLAKRIIATNALK